MSLIHRITRRTRLFSVAVALAATATIGIAGSAHARVNGNPSFTFQWGDCPVTVGNVIGRAGAAVGGADIQCLHHHGTITAKVDLWRYNGSRWVMVRTSGWVTTINNSWLSVQTWGPYCGGGEALWNDTVTVNVDGYYQRTFNLYDGIGYSAKYSPGSYPGC
jgi:hypothetical protein